MQCSTVIPCQKFTGNTISKHFIIIMTAKEIIQHLQLNPHPEGGYYKEVYRSKGTIAADCLPSDFGGARHYSTSIYYLLQQGDYSSFHRIKSDEIWHFYAGGNLLLHLIDKEGGYQCITLGSELAQGTRLQVVVPAGVWFAAEPETSFSLTGCTVSPGFDFRDFEMANAETLAAEFPEHKELVHRLSR